LAFELVSFALSLHLLIIEHIASATFNLALQFLAGTLDPLGCLGSILARLASCLFGIGSSRDTCKIRQ
jgi:hypothetical protein